MNPLDAYQTPPTISQAIDGLQTALDYIHSHTKTLADSIGQYDPALDTPMLHWIHHAEQLDDAMTYILGYRYGHHE